MDLWPVTADRHQLLRRLDEQLAEPPWPDVDRWGESAEAQRQLAKTEAMFPAATG